MSAVGATTKRFVFLSSSCRRRAEFGTSGATTVARCYLFDGGGVIAIPNLSHFQETEKRRLPAIQVTPAANDRNGFDGFLAVPAG